MSVSLTKPVKIVGPYSNRQWRATVDCRVSVGPWMYEGLCRNSLAHLEHAFLTKINGAQSVS